MRDYKIFVDNDNNIVDLDFVNGDAEYLTYSTQTSDQRAALACFICKGTLPGALDFGISWGDVYTTDSTLVQFSNELQQSVQEATKSSDIEFTIANSYNPQIVVDGGKIGVIITRS